MKCFIFLFLILSLSSCASQKKEVIAKSIIKLEEKNTNIRSLIEINGYYPVLPELRYGACMFFEDGTWVYFHFKHEITENEKQENMSSSVQNWIKNGQTSWGSYWGVYSIKNDTIICHTYDEGTLFKGWSLNERRYKIIDRKTIQEIYFRSILKNEDDYYKTHSPWNLGKAMPFIPANNLPSSDNWLKENKWIWRNESDWKAYMEKVGK